MTAKRKVGAIRVIQRDHQYAIEYATQYAIDYQCISSSSSLPMNTMSTNTHTDSRRL